MDQMLRRRRLTALVLCAGVGGMVGLSFAAVPLYRIFCQVTGYGGTPAVEAARSAGTVSDKSVRITLDANINRDLPWSFKPVDRDFAVRLGEETMAFYEAHNPTDRTITGTAVFNVTPQKAAIYFNKIDCFCFTQQTLEPGQTVSMPVLFYVDPAMLDDDNAFDVQAITLSYTFYPAAGDDGSAAAETALVDDTGGAAPAIP